MAACPPSASRIISLPSLSLSRAGGRPAHSPVLKRHNTRPPTAWMLLGTLHRTPASLSCSQAATHATQFPTQAKVLTCQAQGH